MLTAKVIRSFSAAHRLPDYNGACAAVHGHNYKLIVEVGSVWDNLDDQDMILDFKILDEIVESVVAFFDHSLLNDIEGLDNPTAEKMISFIKDMLDQKLDHYANIKKTQRLCVKSLELFETDKYSIKGTYAGV